MVDRITALIKEKGLSINAVEKALGFGNGAIKRFNTSSPSIDKIIALSDFLNVSVEYLLFGKNKSSSPNKLSDDEQELINLYTQLNRDDRIRIHERAEVLLEQSKQKHLDSLFQPTFKSKFIDIFDLPVSAGTGESLTSDYKDLCAVKLNESTSQASFAVRVSGDSMEPLYVNGDILLIALQESVDPDEIGIFIINGEGYVKKYGGDRLISLNSKYEDIMIHDYDNVLCKGKVLCKLEKSDII
ncbi:MAG: S24 family peptidase [Oscillospiraceae bacterium]|nr:S24 family peptidase [Oscillospiraceae bacterium]